MKIENTILSYANLSRWCCGVSKHPPQLPVTKLELQELAFDIKIKLRGSSIMRYLNEGWFVKHVDFEKGLGFIYKDRVTGVIKMLTKGTNDPYNHKEVDMDDLVKKMWGNCGWSVVKPSDRTFQLLLKRK